MISVFQEFYIGNDFCSLSRKLYWFWFGILVARITSSDFLLTNPIIIALATQVRESIWGVYLLLIIRLHLCVQYWQDNPSMGLAHNGPTEMDENCNCPPDIHSIDSDWWTRATFCISGTKVSSEPVTTKSQHVWIISLCEMHSCLDKWLQTLLGKSQRRTFTV